MRRGITNPPDGYTGWVVKGDGQWTWYTDGKPDFNVPAQKGVAMRQRFEKTLANLGIIVLSAAVASVIGAVVLLVLVLLIAGITNVWSSI